MAAIPPAEVDVTVDLVHRLLADQHPDLADQPLRIVANGWDNVMLRLGDDLAVRVPRRTLAARLIDHEIDWLPLLAPHLPITVPAPIRAGVPGHGFPWRWSIVPWADGRTLSTAPVDTRGALAAEFAEFFAALHRPAPAAAPMNPVRGVPLVTRDAYARPRIAGHPQAAILTAVWESALATPVWKGPPLWIHGDPHPANVVVTTGAATGPVALSAIVDFGDLTAGDPASDLATAWLTFDAAGRAAFRARYDALTDRDADTWRRAHGWALHLSLVFLTECDDAPELRAIGVHGLAQVLREVSSTS